jgi:hypothetical protein
VELAMTRDELIALYTTRSGYRRQAPSEGRQLYIDAVIAFLETRDWAAAHEVRLGKPQAAWTPAEAVVFEVLMSRRPAVSADRPIPNNFIVVGHVPETLDALIQIAHTGFDELTERRHADPLCELPTFATVVTLAG